MQDNDLADSDSPSAAPGAAVGAVITIDDAELLRLVEGWPKLPAAIKAGILAMVEAAGYP